MPNIKQRPKSTARSPKPSNDAIPNTHIYFVLDRSGSMASIADDVIGGFNSFLADQQREGDDAILTLIQFDTNDPFEVIADGLPIVEVRRLDERVFVPRGGTPLYDAMGSAISRVDHRVMQRAHRGEPNENMVFVTFTDGEENSSHRYDRDTVFAMVGQREELGWTFVYLGANHDAYAASAAMGFDTRSTQAYLADSIGTKAAFANLSEAAIVRRRKTKTTTAYVVQDFFEGNKSAEADQRRRGRRR